MSKDRGVLKISRHSWHGRVYLNWKDRAEFKNTSAYQENLCHYVRVVLFWAPINWFLKRDFYIERADAHVPPAGFAIAAVLLAVLIFCGITEPIGTGLVVLGVIAFIAAMIGLFVFIDYLKERKEQKRWEEMERRMDPDYVPQKEKDEGFFKVIWRFLAAKKGKICPFIVVNGDHHPA